MKISPETLSILKNYSTINSNITFKTGNVLKTISNSTSIFSQSTVTETFPVEFGIYDIGRFLATVSLFKDPDFTFEKDHVLISNGKSKVNYYYTDPALLTSVPNGIKMPTIAFSFDLSNKEFNELLKAGNVLQAPDICIKCNSKDKTLELIALDKKDPTSNKYSIDLSAHVRFDPSIDVDAELFVKAENLKMILDDYIVDISQKNIVRFTNSKTNLYYYISLESSSVWN